MAHSYSYNVPQKTLFTVIFVAVRKDTAVTRLPGNLSIAHANIRTNRFNSLRPNDAYIYICQWTKRFCSTPSYYLKQRWSTINWTIGDKFQWYLLSKYNNLNKRKRIWKYHLKMPTDEISRYAMVLHELNALPMQRNVIWGTCVINFSTWKKKACLPMFNG